MSEYIYKQLGELVTFQRGKDLPRTSMKNGPYPVIGSNGIIGYHNDFNVQSPCITVGRSGNVGKPYLHLGEAWAHNTCLYVKEFKGCDPLFIYYLLKTLNLERQAGGSAVPTLNRNHIHPLIVKVPKSIEAQKYIATVLFGFDQLISLNSRTNDNLLALASTLFDQEVGKSGTNERKLGQIVDIHDSKRIPLSSRQRENMEKTYPYYGAASKMDYVDKYLFDGIYLLLGEDGTVISEKGFPILQYVWGKFWVNNHAHVLTGRNEITTEILYLLLSKTSVKNIVTGAVQPKINQENLKSLKVVLPSENIIKELSNKIAPLFKLYRLHSEENKRLEKLRDILLSKLF